jgi:lysophospholipase L1-like esterase
MTAGRRTFGIVTLAAALVVAALFGGSAAAARSKPAPKKPKPAPTYLALGDSVAFGYIAGAGGEYRLPDNFAGFPTYVADALRLKGTNAACPGETTASFLSADGQDNGCKAFRGLAPLHVSYSGTQLAFAQSYLRAHKGTTKLVTLQLGANDGFLLEAACHLDPTCIGNGVGQLLATVGGNVDTILGDLRSTGYKGKIVVVNYYSLDYTDVGATQLTQLLNGAVAQQLAAHQAVLADAFTLFQQATGNGNTCTAGLLNANPDPSKPASAAPACDVHPARAGQLLLAQAVERAYGAKG